MRYFGYCTGLSMTNEAFDSLFGRPPREPESPLDQFAMDVAASIQAATEEIVLRIARHVAKTYQRAKPLPRGRCRPQLPSQTARSWRKASSTGSGSSRRRRRRGGTGRRLVAHHMHFGADRKLSKPDGMHGSFLGRASPPTQRGRTLGKLGARLDVRSDDELLEEVADALNAGLTIGWFQGRMEYGPRALGARSIIADARRGDMQRNLNLRIKFRESFRPFAPAVLAEHSKAWFELEGDSPYMLLTAPVREDKRVDVQDDGVRGMDKLNQVRSLIPAVTHVDWSARLQTVHRETNPRFHALLDRFHRKTGCPVVINTSFNIRGEPIVCSPEDAFRCFMGTGLDMLVVENCVLYKDAQDQDLLRPYREQVQLD